MGEFHKSIRATHMPERSQEEEEKQSMKDADSSNHLTLASFSSSSMKAVQLSAFQMPLLLSLYEIRRFQRGDNPTREEKERRATIFMTLLSQHSNLDVLVLAGSE